MFTRTNNKPITLSLKHKYSKSHSTELRKKKIAHVLVSFTTVIRGNDIFLLTPRCYTSCRFLPEIDKSSDILEPVTLGVSVEHFGISLQTEGLAKGLQVGETILLEKSKTEMSRNKSRHCTAVQNSAILFGGRL